MHPPRLHFKHVRFIFLVWILVAHQHTFGQQKKTSMVNPFIGTDAHGHTFPGATLPFGMVQLSPDTRVAGWDACGGYHYSDSIILGFSHTHLSGTGVPDYGDILFMPFHGDAQNASVRKNISSRFSHHKESASPGYYRVELNDHSITAELSATKRVGVHRYTISKPQATSMMIDLQHGLGPDRVIDSWISLVGDREVVGMRRSRGWAKDQVVYFAARFSKSISSHFILENDSNTTSASDAHGTNLKCFLQFAMKAKEQLVIKVALSSVDVDAARKNLESEVPHWDFDRVKNEAESAWENELGKIAIEGGTKDQQTTFYTALYHAMIAPNLQSDIDGRYRGMDGNIHATKDFDMYTVFSLWDTFRAEHPLLTIIDQKRTRDFVRSLLAKYDETGHLPVWEFASNETWCMIGYHSVPVIVDAYMKGIRDFDATKAFEAMQKSAGRDHFGLRAYREMGCIMGDDDGESVSKTLEYAYDDWCIAQFAKAIGKEIEFSMYAKRAQHYKNLFDPVTGFHRPKLNGDWLRPFDPTSVTMHFTEANAWQYNFFVPHDVEGLMQCFGSKQRFIAKLDSLFFGDSRMSGRVQSDITGLIGQYAQGNEPSHHVAYLYNMLGAPWKTQQLTRLILDSLYTARPDGLCGNDDCGQMSAWYVLSAIGLYPVLPGLSVYSMTSPLFRNVTIHLENGGRFDLHAENNSKANPYIEESRHNGIPYTKSFFHHSDIIRGGELRFRMSSKPMLESRTSDRDEPIMIPMKSIVSQPLIHARSKSFSDSLAVSIESIRPDLKIMYSLPSENGGSDLLPYSAPITITESSTIEAMCQNEDGEYSDIVSAKFTKRSSRLRITLQSRYSEQYTGSGDDALIDGERGGNDFRASAWQGYEGVDLVAEIDLGGVQTVDTVTLSALQDINSWIFFPMRVEFSAADESKNFGAPVVVANDVSEHEESVMKKEFRAAFPSTRARYIRVRAHNVGRCPVWHKGAGGKAWLFVDEVSIEAKS